MKKINIVKVEYFIWLAAIFATFLPNKLYVPLFVLFSAVVLLYHCLIELRIRRFDALLGYAIFIFVVVASFSFALNRDVSNTQQYVKIVVNMLFLFSSFVFVGRNADFISKHRLPLNGLIVLIITLSFLQVFANVYRTHVWFWPLQGVADSTSAYVIASPGVYFGNPGKNIWAAKMAFVQIVFLALCAKGFVRMPRWMKYGFIALSLFNIVYTFSRTAQLMYFVPLAYFVYIDFVKGKAAIVKLFIVMVLLALVPFAGYYVYEKLMHFGGSGANGLSARFVIWNLGASHFSDSGIMQKFLGNGILSGAHIIRDNLGWLEDNFHNVFLNTLMDTGLAGLAAYAAMLALVIFNGSWRGRILFRLAMFVVPVMVCLNSQYLGYDSDVVAFFGLFQILVVLPLAKESDAAEPEYETPAQFKTQAGNL